MGSFYYACDESGSFSLSVAKGATRVVPFAGFVCVGESVIVVVAVQSKKVWD